MLNGKFIGVKEETNVFSLERKFEANGAAKACILRK